MIHNTIPIKSDKTGNDAKLITYCYSYSKEILVEKRPCVMICPGGGYEFLSDREAETLAFQFNAFGYQAVIFRYSIAPVTYPAQAIETALAFNYLVEHADEYYIDPSKIAILGCSAGAHVAAFYGTNWHTDLLTKDLGLKKETQKPAAMILCYPVITSGEYAHRGSFNALLGDKKDDPEMLKNVSIENLVTKNTPPTFLWHTFTDHTVPVENSLFMANALKKADVPFEMHIFPTGGHGLSLATDLTMSPHKCELDEGAKQWLELCKNWLRRLFGPLC